MLRRAQHGGEAGARVEAGKAEPVDRAFAADEGGRLAVADERIVFDSRHRTPLPPARPGGRLLALSRGGMMTWAWNWRISVAEATREFLGRGPRRLTGGPGRPGFAFIDLLRAALDLVPPRPGRRRARAV